MSTTGWILTIGVLIVGVFILSRIAREDKGLYLCTTCGWQGTPKKKEKGSILIALILLCLFIIPGVIYIIWSISTEHNTCPKCGKAMLAHRVCTNCGHYRGKEMVNVIKKVKKNKK